MLHDDNKEYLYTDRVADLWDAATGKVLVRLRKHKDRVVSAEVSPDGQTVLTASWDGSARLWDAATGKEMAVLQKGDRSLLLAAFSPDGKRALAVVANNNQSSSYGDRNLAPALVDPEKPGLLRATKEGSQGSSGYTTGSGNFTFGRGDPVLAYLWDVAGGKEPVELKVSAKVPGQPLHPTVAVFSPDGKRVAIGTKEGYALVWNAGAGGEEIAFFQTSPNVRPPDVRCLAFSPDGARLATGGNDFMVRIWNVGRGKGGGQELHALRNSDSTHGVAFDPAGNRLLSYGPSGARLWNSIPGTEFASLNGSAGWVKDGRFSADGQRVITTDGNKVRVYRTQLPPLERRLTRLESGVTALDYGPRGELLSAGASGLVHVYPPGSDKPLVLGKDKHLGAIRSAQFLPGGARLVTASEKCLVLSGDDKMLNGSAVHVWDAKTGADLLALTEHETGASQIRPSPDGKRLLTVSDGSVSSASVGFVSRTSTGPGRAAPGLLRVWDLDSGKLLRTLPGDPSAAIDARFTSAGDGLLVLERSEDLREPLQPAPAPHQPRDRRGEGCVPQRPAALPRRRQPGPEMAGRRGPQRGAGFRPGLGPAARDPARLSRRGGVSGRL